MIDVLFLLCTAYEKNMFVNLECFLLEPTNKKNKKPKNQNNSKLKI